MKALKDNTITFIRGYYAYERWMERGDTACIELAVVGEDTRFPFVDILGGTLSIGVANWNVISGEQPEDFKLEEYEDLKSAKDSKFFPYLMEAANLLLRNIDPEYGEELKQMIEDAK